MASRGKAFKPNEIQKALIDAMIYGSGELRISHIPFRMSHLKNCLKKKASLRSGVSPNGSRVSLRSDVSLTLKKGRKKT